jgi:probable rRNA maturation factor
MAASSTPSTGRPETPHGNTPSDIDVEFSDTQAHLRVDHASLRELVRCVLHLEGCDRASISIAIVDDDTIHRINRTHLEHDWPTDVITFPLSEPGEEILLGELVVSAETACAMAREHSQDAASELALYVAHGILHLCGYDDRNPADAAAMRKRECEVLAAARLRSNTCQPNGH